MAIHPRLAPLAALALAAFALGGCATSKFGQTASLGERECMARVMYFESLRSSEEGMAAVGTVVMNRVQSPKYPKSVCGVVAQENQFAPGALSKPAGGTSYTRALKVADEVLGGRRHNEVGGAMFFHTAGYSFPYRNMHYVALAGGNVFYEKRTPGTFTPGLPARSEPSTMFADATPAPRARSRSIMLAAAETRFEPRTDASGGGGSPTLLGSSRAMRRAPVAAPQVAWNSPAPTWRARAEPSRSAPVVVVARTEPASSVTRVRLAATQPPMRPTIGATEPAPRSKPIVVAMLDAKPRPLPPRRSIAELIEMDLQQQ